jgi:hypothetical protein
MGGEGYMTENEIERLWRDSRINMIVEGANEVMHSFVFAYGSKQLGEHMLDIRGHPMQHIGEGLRLAMELFMGVRKPAPQITGLRPELAGLKRKLEQSVRELSHQLKLMFKEQKEALITRQMIQARISWCALWIHTMSCCLSRADQSLRAGTNGKALDDELRTVEFICDMATHEIAVKIRELRENTDQSMLACAAAALRQADSQPNSDYVIPERTPDEAARGTGRVPDQTHIQQFGSGSTHIPADTAS